MKEGEQIRKESLREEKRDVRRERWDDSWRDEGGCQEGVSGVIPGLEWIPPGMYFHWDRGIEGKRERRKRWRERRREGGVG